MRYSEALYERIYVDHIPALEHGVVGLKYPVGSATDGIRTGVAHFVEHLVCRFWQQRLGLHIQAETAREQTSYWFHTSTADLSQPMSVVLQERISLVRDDVDKERSIILRELQQKSTSARYLGLTELQAATFGQHGYARPVIGSAQDVEKIGLEDLELALRYYRAPATICVAGPWGEADVHQNLDDFRITSVPEETTSRPQHYFAGRFSPSKLADRTFCAATWVIPGYSELSDRALKLLEGLWNRRLSAARLSSRLRVSSYRHAATLTL